VGAGGEEEGAKPRGGVADVFLVRKDGSVLTNMTKRAKIQEQLSGLQRIVHKASDKKKEKAEKKVAKVQEKLEKVSKKLNEAGEAGKTNAVVGSFVMFHSEDAQQDCVRHYSSEGANRPVCLKPRPEFLLDGKRVAVRDAPEPSDLVWENLEVGRVERAGRKCVSSFFSVLVIVISIAVIVYGKTYNESLKVTGTQCTDAITIQNCNEGVAWTTVTAHGCSGGASSCTVADAWGVDLAVELPVTPLHLDTAASPLKTSILSGADCRLLSDADPSLGVSLPSAISTGCKSNATVTEGQWKALVETGFSGLGGTAGGLCAMCTCKALQDSGSLLWWQSFGDSATIKMADGTAMCTAQANDFFVLLGLQLAAVAVVVIFNTIMKTTTQLLAFFEKHHTLAEQETSIAIAVFVGQFVNTALVSLLVYAEISTIKNRIKDALQGDASAFPIFAGSYSDFSEQWYGVVGAQLMLTIIINVFLPLVPLVTAALVNCCLPCMTKGVASQQALNIAYLGADFVLSTRYGMLLNTIFTCFMYASGMPILLFVGACICFVTYWIDKIQLLRFSRLPPQYSDKLAMYILTTFKYAILLHMLFAVWVFSATKVTGDNMFPRPSLSADFDKTIQGWVDEAFGCVLHDTEAKCLSTPSCMWASTCIVDTSSQEWKDYASFSFFQRLFNAITFPYFFFTILFVVVIVLKWTPLWPFLSAIRGLIAELAAERWKKMRSRNKVAQAPPPEAPKPPMPDYLDAVSGGRFGNFATDYNITQVGRYKDLFENESNLQLFRKLSPYQSILEGK